MRREIILTIIMVHTVAGGGYDLIEAINLRPDSCGGRNGDQVSRDSTAAQTINETTFSVKTYAYAPFPMYACLHPFARILASRKQVLRTIVLVSS